MMRIGIDARELSGRATGVGRYLASLCTEWAHLPGARGCQFILYSPRASEELPPRLRETIAHAGAERFEVRVVQGSGGTLWEQLHLPAVVNRDRGDVFFAPGYSAPLTLRAPMVVSVHDVSFFAHPEWFHWREGLRRRWLVRQSARNARLVLTPSEFSRREITAHLRLPDRLVRTIPAGVTPLVHRETPARREPLVLFVGAIFNRRRLPDLIEAFAHVARRAPASRLAIVGENRTYPWQDLPALARLAGVAQRVTFTSFVPDDELTRLYARARVFVFLSEYEGFGLTPLEALVAEVPIVVLDTPVAREVYGDAARFVRRGDIQGIADTMLTLIEDERAREAVLAHAPAVLRRYSWERAARETLGALVEATERTG